MTDKPKSLREMAEAWIRHQDIGPCLLPNLSAAMPTHHEVDACSCNVAAAYEAGYREALLEAVAIAKDESDAEYKPENPRDYSMGRADGAYVVGIRLRNLADTALRLEEGQG